MRNWLVGLLIFLAGSAAAAKDFSTWKKYTQADLIRETTAFAPGNIGTLGLRIKLAPTWHTYWVNPGDSGTPVHIRFKTSHGYSVSRVLFPLPERELSGPLTSFVYENEVVFPIEVKVARDLRPGEQLNVEADIEWLVCVESCIPANQTLQTSIPIASLTDIKPSAEYNLFQRTRRRLPSEAGDSPRLQFTADAATLQIASDNAQDEFIDFFPFPGSGVNNTKPTFSEGGLLHFEKSTVPSAGSERVGVLVVKTPTGDMAVQYGNSGWKFSSKEDANQSSLLWMMLSAFIGGLILNLMPCVFPILSIKLLSLLKLVAAHPREVRQQNLAYVIGVLISFLSIALVLSLLRSAGHLVGWGFQLQSPVFLTLLTWLFFALALNLFGVYEIDLLNASWGNNLTRLGGISGAFFTGVLAVVVASPCTAPFMGVALGFGLSQSIVVLLSIFFFLGLGLAFPYLLFVLFPSWIRFLPRPGAWMNVVKKVMAFPLLLTTLWMLWILHQVRGPLAVSTVVAGCVAIGLALGLPVLLRKATRFATVLLLVFAVVYIYRSETHASSAPAVQDGPWQAFSPARMSSLKGRNLFVNMTADWCLTCKVNERLVFDDPEVRTLLEQKGVIWLKGDWTERNEEVTRFLNQFDRAGVPFYVLYSARNPAGTTLPEVLTKSVFMDYLKQEFP